jgi:PKD repeat protein
VAQLPNDSTYNCRLAGSQGVYIYSKRDTYGRTMNSYAVSSTRLRAGLLSLLVLACYALLLLVAAAALASEPPLAAVSPYGEVTRWGGYAEEGHIVGAKFNYPVGFAVDPANEPDAEEKALSPAVEDHNAVYVLDRVVNDRSGLHLQYRLQKLSSTGVVLGSVLLPPQTYTDGEHLGDAHPMFALAVDSARHRVYALVESSVEPVKVRNEKHTTVAAQLVAWSTEPKKNGSGERELAPAVEASGASYPSALEGKAALVAGALQSSEPGGDLAIPEGLAVNPATHAVAIEAQDGLPNLEGGPTALWNVQTEGTGRGTVSPPWTAATIASETEKGTGVFTTTTGKYGIDLWNERVTGTISLLATVNGGLTEASPLAEDKSGGVDLDQAPSIDSSKTANENGASDASVLSPFTAGSAITQLSNELYAARYGNEVGDEAGSTPDLQAQGLWSGAPLFWWRGGPGSDNEVVNMGIRLFDAQGHIVTTIGGQPEGEPCDLNSEQMSLAAGAKGSLFVLTQPDQSNGDSGDQVIEFAPGGAGACPVPSISQVLVTQNGKVAESGKHGEPVVYQGGAPVKFEVTSLERKGERPFAFAWNVTGGPGSSFSLFSEMDAANEYHWPNPAVEYEYKASEVGLREGTVSLEGDYGTITFPFKVLVLGTEEPKAAIGGPATVVEGQAVEYTGSGSKPTPGSTIELLRWEFSDNGSHAEEAPPQESQSHTFTKPGTYKVKLTIFDETGKHASVEKEVTVQTAAKGCETNCGGGTPGGGNSAGGGGSPSGGGTTSGGSQTGPQPQPGPSVKTSQTQHPSKLTRALEACHKDKNRHKRTICEAQARRKYATKTPIRKKTGKNKK